VTDGREASYLWIGHLAVIAEEHHASTYLLHDPLRNRTGEIGEVVSGDGVECALHHSKTDWESGEHVENGADLPSANGFGYNSMAISCKSFSWSEWQFPQSIGAPEELSVEERFVNILVAQRAEAGSETGIVAGIVIAKVAVPYEIT